MLTSFNAANAAVVKINSLLAQETKLVRFNAANAAVVKIMNLPKSLRVSLSRFNAANAAVVKIMMHFFDEPITLKVSMPRMQQL